MVGVQSAQLSQQYVYIVAMPFFFNRKCKETISLKKKKETTLFVPKLETINYPKVSVHSLGVRHWMELCVTGTLFFFVLFI